ncbi:MAG TPA: response regulator [Pirellulales bacterium]|nr:response regulator [Pirellulales bacterium]
MAMLAPLRVFVVDDDQDTTESMRLLLKHWGHEVHVANDGFFAVEQAPHVKPDLMLVDLAMPKFDGLAVARRLRSEPALAEMPLVALTGYADLPHRQQALEAGFDECLVKPLPADDLLGLLDRVRTRIAASADLARRTLEIAAQSRQQNQLSRRGLDE